MVTAAADMAAIGSVIGEANSTAAAATTGVMAAAGDEVSVATAALFGAYAQDYQAIINQAGVFHDQSAAALAAASAAYVEGEVAAPNSLRALMRPAEASAAGVAAASPAAATPVDVGLILGASGVPIPNAQYIAQAYAKYVSPFFTTNNILTGTPHPSPYGRRFLRPAQSGHR